MGEHRSWNRMPTKRCSANVIMDEFIILDEDDDFPESSKRKAPGTSRTGNEFIPQRVISIDDDDDEDDDTEHVQKAGGNTSRRDSLGANLPSSLEEDNNDDCQVVEEKCAAFRFSKCKQTFSTMPSSGCRFGLGSDSENEFSDSDCSDCEILEGSNGEVREQWEKAFLRKMRNTSKAGLNEEVGPSDLPSCSNFRPGFESRTEQENQTSSFCPARNLDGGNKTSSTFFGADDRNPKKTFFDPGMQEGDRARNCANSKCFSKQDFPGPSSHEKQVEHESSDSPPTHFTSSKERIHQNSFKEVEKQQGRVQVQCETSQSTKENRKKNAACHQSYTKKVEKEDENASNSSPPQTSDGFGDTMRVLDTQTSRARCEDGLTSFSESREPTIDPIPSTSEKVKDSNATAPTINIMLGREKLKETDEYKKAQEEEWESRQRQLQIQAEEAQRQRKRRKLETMRKLEMERRQKERIEEVRETQKKDEEVMKMKEKIRSDITKSLKLLELKCANMASLLRGLGIHVGGGPSPLPNEVHAAYKLALLKFHPDRASGGDIKQQVEAEEKFKLIARMKDKFNSN